jgi:hypothetical protein
VVLHFVSIRRWRLPMRSKFTFGLVVAASIAALTPLAGHADGLRFPFTGSLQGGGRVVMAGTPGYTTDYMTRCGGAPMLETEAAGNTSLLGLVDDFQTHCLGLPVIVNGQVDHIPFFNGKFRFTDVHGRYIDGQYHGKLTPTVHSQPPPVAGAPPTGTWIIEGQVCISGASPQLRIANDCAPGRYFAARGISDPLAGTATIYLNQTLGVRW